MKKTFEKSLAVFFAFVMLFTMAVSVSAYDDMATTTRPYETINFCHVCGAEFCNESAYNLHIIICNNLNSPDALVYLCGYCGDKSESKIDLASHSKGCAEDSYYYNPSNICNWCYHCDGEFKVESEFNNHIQLCCPVEECENCGREVVSKYYEEHLDDCGSGKTLSFMDRIVAFFERIVNFFKNLF